MQSFLRAVSPSDLPSGARAPHGTRLAYLLLLAAFSLGAGANPVAAADVARGRLLYEAHCGSCHATNFHWREKRIVHTWQDLVAQVTRWQGNAGQQWSQTEIEDVAAFLNTEFYRLPCPAQSCGSQQLSAIEKAPHAARAASLAPR